MCPGTRRVGVKDADWMVTVPVMRIWVEVSVGLRGAWVGLI